MASSDFAPLPSSLHSWPVFQYRHFLLDKGLEVEGFEDLIEDAEKAYDNYSMDMQRLMAQFSLKCEEEVILGRAVVWHPLLNGDRYVGSRSKAGSY
jgi:hypothetical protein